MKQLMLQHAFEFVQRVLFLVGSQNIPSQKAVEKIGGVRIGTRLSDDGTKASSSRSLPVPQFRT
jgi:hypothetical protein